jgi:O-antigen ligase
MQSSPTTAARSAARWQLRIIGFGLFWLLAGVALTPGALQSSSHYHTIVTLTLFLPALWLAVLERHWLRERIAQRPELIGAIVLLLWSAVSLFWASGNHVAERLKVPLQIACFGAGWLCWTHARGRQATEQLLRWAGYALALGALAALIAFPWRHTDFPDRIIGFAMLDGPNLSGYVMGATALWLFQLPPAGARERLFWLACLVCLLVFCALTLSRGTWLALFVAALCLPIFDRRRRALAVAAGAVIIAIVGAIWAHRLIEARGSSHRLEIWAQARQLIEARPWLGLGLETPYQISSGQEVWTHSHNLFTSLAIELGAPALLCWVVVWLLVVRRGWSTREVPLGRIVLVLWIFSSVALQLDGPALLSSPRAEWLLTWLPLLIGAALTKENGKNSSD